AGICCRERERPQATAGLPRRSNVEIGTDGQGSGGKLDGKTDLWVLVAAAEALVAEFPHGGIEFFLANGSAQDVVDIQGTEGVFGMKAGASATDEDGTDAVSAEGVPDA